MVASVAVDDVVAVTVNHCHNSISSSGLSS